MAMNLTLLNTGVNTELRKIVKLTLTDATNFVVSGDITGDGVASNDGVGTIQKKDGNEVWVIILSGTFVAGNDVDNEEPYDSSETGIVSVDSTYWELEHDLENPNVNAIVLYVNFVKNLSNLAIVASYKDENWDEDNFYNETLCDSSGNITIDTRNLTSSGSWRLIYNQSKAETVILLTITPVNITGTDNVELFLAENHLERVGR